MHKITKTETKVFPRVSSIFLMSDAPNAFSLEIATDFTEKEITEMVYESHFKPNSTCTQTMERVVKKWKKVDTYHLRQVSISELIDLRLSKVPGIVYKKDNLYFYTAINCKININGRVTNLGKHACGNHCSMVCKGCPKINALTVAYQQRIGKKFRMAVRDSWRLEKYDFIREGLEAFNMNAGDDALIVLQCDNYQFRPEPPKHQSSKA